MTPEINLSTKNHNYKNYKLCISVRQTIDKCGFIYILAAIFFLII